MVRPSSATRLARASCPNSTRTPGAHATGKSSAMRATLPSAPGRPQRRIPWGSRAGVGAAVLVLLNLVDGVCTHVFLSAGVARELNPLMRLAYVDGGPGLFFTCKVLAVGTAAWILQRYAARVAVARGALAGGVALYGGVCLLHLWLLVRWVG